MTTPLQDLQASIQLARAALEELLRQEQVIVTSATHNTFDTRENADMCMEDVLRSRAFEDCEGANNLGCDEYTQEFMVGSIKYEAKMTFEYNRHDKTYYYIDASEYISKEI